MAGNSIGRIFKITTFGESHGPAIGAVIDGVKPGMKLSESDIQAELNRRRPGQSKLTTQRSESDTVEILSGVFEGKTTGTPIALLIRNTDAKSKDYAALKNIFRPGHADYTYHMKYGIRDHRGGGRSSGRETAARVAAGAVAKKILKKRGITVTAYTRAVGDVWAKEVNLKTIESNPVRCPDPRKVRAMIQKIEEVQKRGDSIGGIIEAVVKGCPAGVGDPVFGKLDARIAQAVISIGTIIGVEFGMGFAAANMTGSQCNDSFCMKGGVIRTKTNNAGGILGGISTGSEIIVRMALKPPPSISLPQKTVTVRKRGTTIEVKGRHDPCICPRAVPVVESMIAITLLDCLLIQDNILSQRKK